MPKLGQASPNPASRLRLFIVSLGMMLGLGGTHAIPVWLVQAGGPLPAVIGVLTGVLLLILISRNLRFEPDPVPAGPNASRSLLTTLAHGLMFAAFLSTLAWIGIQITELPAYLFPGLRTGTIVHAAGGLPVYLTPALIGLAVTVLLFLLNFRRTRILTIPQTLFAVVTILAGLAVIIASWPRADLSNLLPVYGKMMPGNRFGMFGGILSQLAVMPFYLAGISVFMLSGKQEPAKQTPFIPFALARAGILYSLMILGISAVTPWPSFAAHRPPAAAALLLDTYGGQTGDMLYGLVLIGTLAGLVCIWNGIFFTAGRMLTSKIRRSASVICLFAAAAGPFLGPEFLSLLGRIGAVTLVAGWLLMALADRPRAVRRSHR